MTPTLTPERLQELLKKCDDPFVVQCSGCEVAGYGPTGAPEPDCFGHEVVEVSPVELRALIAAAQQVETLTQERDRAMDIARLYDGADARILEEIASWPKPKN